MSPSAEQFFAHNPSSLPTMPEVASRLLKSFDDENISLGAIADLVGKDAALAAKVLRLANSAHYSPSHTVASLQDAAVTLGLERLRNLALAACISGSFPAVQGLDRARFWRHSLVTAGYARLLARVLEVDADTAYLAGLMLRTGQLLMARYDPVLVADVEAQAELAEPGSRASLEQHRFGCSHAEVTAALAQRWHFPAALVTAFHDAQAPLEAKPFSRVAALLRLAEVLADAAERQTAALPALQQAEGALLEHLHVDQAFLAAKIEAAGDLGADVDALLH